MKIAINGFGRIGRLILRAAFENDVKDLDIIAINDLQSIDSAIHLLKHDSVHRFFNKNIKKISETLISIDGKEINYFSEKNPMNLPWERLNIDLVMECTGIFRTKETCAQHIKAGAKKVLLSCPGDSEIKTIVFGVNDDIINKNEDLVISAGSCTTNCLAPIVKVLNSEYGIEKGNVSTIHSYTGDQNIVDTFHKDLRRSRAAALNIIPTTTGVTKTIEKIFLDLKGKISGLAFRVPTADVSLVDCNFLLKKNVTAEEIRETMLNWSISKLKKNILRCCDEELVSSDFVHSIYSSIVDLPLIKVVDSNFVHIVSWYDNEWGFANRMLDNACLLF